ncbi:LysR family substrate-binding domain-containing protein (plasmid) [Pantoea sp. C3]|uniref:LysR family substrate-binding domain-containing protein n=1 Tax=Pantoea phytostimulans TaxID=2769024 RepID=UPI0038F773A8
MRERAIDLALLHTPPEVNDMFKQEKILTEPVILAMPKERMLLAPGPDDLNGQPWIVDQENRNPPARARLLAACQKGGFRPNICLEVSGPLAALACVEAGLGFIFIQKSLARIVPDNVALVSLPWLPLEITLFAVWRKEETRPLTKRFLATLGLY